MSALAQAWVATVRTGNQTAKQLLQFLASQNFGNPDLFFKAETLANQLEVSLRSIQRAFKLLEQKKLIVKQERYNSSGQQLSNHVYVNVPQDFIDRFYSHHKQGEGDTPSGRRVTQCRGEGDTLSPLNNNINNNYINKSFKSSCASVDARDQIFDTFWNIYPKKKNKKAARKIWQRLPKEILPLILEKLKAQIENEVQWRNPKYIPLPTKYLDGELWNDEVTNIEMVENTSNQAQTPSMYAQRMIEKIKNAKNQQPKSPFPESNWGLCHG